MATANSAQREPSMEEILASIRRIIEDSDGGRRQTGDMAAGVAESAVEVDAAEDDAMLETAAPEVEVFRAELRAGNAAPEPKKPISLAEVQAQLAAGQPDHPQARESAIAAQPASAVESAARARALAEIGVGSVGPSASDVVEAPVAGGRLEPAVAPQPAASGFTAEQEAGEVEIDDDDLILQDEPEPATQAALFRPALVSEETSRQVAAAFGELSEAFASRGKKSFDEMAEEMLRPMLQDWLDNNLPTLVERLVREEIERVARGGA